MQWLTSVGRGLGNAISFHRTSRAPHVAGIRVAAFAAFVALLIGNAAQAVDYSWNQTATPKDWSLNTNWTPTAVVSGPDAPDLSVLINTAITATNTINLFTIGNPGDNIKTVGRLDIGDTDGTNFFTIATGTGFGILNFNSSSGNAQLNELSTSKGDTISAPITLDSSLDITNASATTTNTLTLSGGITAATAGTKTITGSTGLVTISGIIGNGSGTVAVVQNGAGTLTLSGANTFGGGVTIKSGTVVAGNSKDVSAIGLALGTGTVTIGDSSGSANATLQSSYNGGSNNPITYPNPIVVASGSSNNTLSLGSTGGSDIFFSGGITLNNNLTVFEYSGGSQSSANITTYLQLLTGTISGSGNLTLNVNGNFSLTNSTAPGGLRTNMIVASPINMTGSLISNGTGSGVLSVSGNISNVRDVTQNSPTAYLFLGGLNTYLGPTNVNAGVLRVNSSTAIPDNNTITVASGATLQTASGVTFGTGQTLNLSGNGTPYTTGALEAINNATFSGSIVLQANATVSNDLATTTFNLTGTSIDGLGNTLTVTGGGNTTITGMISTGSGGLVKLGTGLLTLSAWNTFNGPTAINRGAVLLNNAKALDGTDSITFGGGSLRYSSTTADYASKFVNSTAPISIDTVALTPTLASGIPASNTGGLAKLGTGTLTLSGTNLYSGITAVSAGSLVVNTTAALPAGSNVFLDVGGALKQGGAYALVQDWLTSGKVDAGSTGAIALAATSGETIDFTGFSNLMLGATSTATFTGAITPAGGVYRLGGGGAALTLSGTDVLNSTNSLVVGAKNGTGASTGSVEISGANTLSGTTTINVGTLKLSGTAGGLASSDVTANPGTTLALTASTSASSAVTRAKSVTLNNATLTDTGNTSTNSTDTITNALTIGSGYSSVTLTAGSTKNTLLTLGSYVHNPGGTVLFRGTNLGVNTLVSTTGGASNISITTPNLVGGTGANVTDGAILVGAIGDITTGGSGYTNTGGLVTVDANKGLRVLSPGEYKTSITDGQTTQLDNVRLTSTGGTLLTTTLNSATTINSLSLNTSGMVGSTIAVTGLGTLTLNSGVIYNAVLSPVVTDLSISNTLDFNGKEAIIFSNCPTVSNNSATLQLSGALTNTGGNGLTVQQSAGSTTLSGAANTYTGTTTLNGGNLNLNKAAGATAVPGNLVINSGTLNLSANEQIADAANVTVNGGTFDYNGKTETINNLTVNGGSATSGSGSGGTLNVSGNATVSGGASLATTVAGKINVTGALNLSDGGTVTLRRSNSVAGLYDGVMTLTGGLNITNTSSGAYTPININFGAYSAQSGAMLLLKGDVTFTGNATNTNTTTIDGPTGTGRQGVVALDSLRTFNIGNGAAAADLTITAPLTDNGATVGSLTKTGAGTLLLAGTSTYTGATAVNAGKLSIASTGSINATSGITIDGAGAELNYNSATALSKPLAFSGAGGTLSGSGTIGVAVSAGSIGTVSPGNSAGSQTYSAGLDLSGGGTYKWELGAYSTANPGTDFDQLVLSGGNLALAGTSKLSVNFLTVGNPDNGNSFWDSGHQWKVIDVTGTGTNSPSTNFNALVGGAYTKGSFTATIGTGLDAGDIFLNYALTPAGPTNSTWGPVISDSKWSTGTNWTPNTAPSGAGTTANFTGNTPATVNVDSAQIVGRLLLTGSAAYSIGGATSATLTMNNTGGTDGPKAVISANASSGTPLHTIASQVVTNAASNLDVTVSGTASLSLSGGIDNTAAKLVKLTQAGSGTLEVGNVTNAGAGVLEVTGGTVSANAISGSGETKVDASASLTADSIVQGTLSIAAGGVVTIRETTGGNVNAVPEPGTWVLIGTALLGLLAFRRRLRG
jgi:autotransporter-associated beta strand protein